MKKIIISLLVVCMLASCIVVFASCNKASSVKPELDLEEAKDALEDEDYMVQYSDDEDDLGVGVKESLAAYNEDDDGLYIIVYADSKLANLAYEEVKAEYDVEVESIKREIKQLEHILDKYEDDLDSDEVDEYEDKIKELKKELEEMEEDYTFGKSGKTVWYGTVDAAKDSKG